MSEPHATPPADDSLPLSTPGAPLPSPAVADNASAAPVGSVPADAPLATDVVVTADEQAPAIEEAVDQTVDQGAAAAETDSSDAEATLLDAAATDAAKPAPASPRPPEMSPAECGARLAALFPALFGTEGPRKPIKLRIQADLQVRAPGMFSKRVLGMFLSRYTTTTAYLRALSTATQRIDLDGQPAGDIAEEHRAAALAELERRREIVAARRAAERAAARPPRGERSAGEPGARPERVRHLGPPLREGEAAPSERPPRPARSGPPVERGAGPRPERRPDDRRPGARSERAARGDRGHPDHRQAGRPVNRHVDRHADRRPPPQAAGHALALPAEAPPEITDPAQRERAMLLRQFESSPLTKANFCVLKRITEAELDAQLAQARAEQPKAAARRRP